jgi:predicted kinase
VNALLLLLLLLLQADAEAADRAERARLQQLAEEIKQWNALRLMELSERECEER